MGWRAGWFPLPLLRSCMLVLLVCWDHRGIRKSGDKLEDLMCADRHTNWTLPRWTLLCYSVRTHYEIVSMVHTCRAGPSGYCAYPWASVISPSSPGSVKIKHPTAPASCAAIDQLR